MAPFFSQDSPVTSAVTCALEAIGTIPKSKVASVLVGFRCDSIRCRSMRHLARSASFVLEQRA